MLYVDFPLELPTVMPNPKYRIRVQPDNTVLLYMGSSKRGKDGKLIHPRRPVIGKVVEKDGSQVFYANDRFFELFPYEERPPAMSKVKGRGRPPKIGTKRYAEMADGQSLCFGYALAWLNEAKSLGIKGLLEEVFGNDKASMILTIAAFYAFDNERGLTLLEKFAKTQMCFTEKILNSQRACELFKEISESELQRFFRGWLTMQNDDKFCFYDVTSISYTGDGITEAAWGYNRDNEELPQVNLGLFVSSKSSLPLFYCDYNGGINDFTNFPYVMSNAQYAGLKGHVTVVGDRIFSETASANKVYELGYGLLVGMQVYRSEEVREKLLAWQANPDHHAEITQSPFDDMTSSSCDFMLGKIPGRLFMYRQDAAAALEANGVRAAVKKIAESLNQQEGERTQRPSKRVCKYFDVTKIKDEEKNTTSYKITPNNDKINDALTLCGCFAIFTTEKLLSAYECLDKYRLKDKCEKNFANLKNELIGERMLVHCSEAWHGKLFILFVSLILRTSLHNKLKPWIRKNRSSLRAVFVEMSEIKCRKQGDRWVLKEAINRPQKEIAELLELPLDYLQNTILL